MTERKQQGPQGRAAAPAAGPGARRRLRGAAGRQRARRLREPGAARAAARTRHQRPRRRVRHRTRLRHLPQPGACSTRSSPRPPAARRTRIDPVLLDLLRLGAYQLLRTRVGAHAAVATTVELAGIEFDSARAGFVNGVLRTIAGRDEASWVAELAPDRSQRPGRSRRVRTRPPALDRPGLRRRARRRCRRTRGAAGQRRRAPAGAPGGPPGRADRRRAGRRRAAAPSAATRRTRCTWPAATPAGWPRSATGPRWSRTRAASWCARALTLRAGRRRHRTLAGPLRRAGRQGRAAGRPRRPDAAPG